jgi:hypothetical protein
MMEENKDSVLPTHLQPKRENSRLVMTSKVLFFFSLAFSSLVVGSLFANSMRANFHQFDDGLSPYKYE